jgi:hypothetical protein
MTAYRVICTNQEPASQPPQHAHIVSIGVGITPDHYNQRFTLQQVIQMIDRGDQFYTIGPSSGKKAMVEKYVCQHCRQYHIKSSADAVRDNNLDSLPYCQI